MQMCVSMCVCVCLQVTCSVNGVCAADVGLAMSGSTADASSAVVRAPLSLFLSTSKLVPAIVYIKRGGTYGLCAGVLAALLFCSRVVSAAEWTPYRVSFTYCKMLQQPRILTDIQPSLIVCSYPSKHSSARARHGELTNCT